MDLPESLSKLVPVLACNTEIVKELQIKLKLQSSDTARIECISTENERALELLKIAHAKKNGYVHIVNTLRSFNLGDAVDLLPLPERAKHKFDFDLAEWGKDTNAENCKKSKVAIRFGIKNPSLLFTGRLDELATLRSIFQETDNKQPNDDSRTVLICGLGGIGKTQLARQFIYRHGALFDDNIAWMNAESEELLSSDFRKLATQHLNITDTNADHDQKSITSIVNEVYKACTKGRVLFVFDNIESDDYMNQFLPTSSSSVCVLITSRNVDWGVSASYIIRVGELSQKDAIEFVRKGLTISEASRDKILCLVHKLQYFPLAIQQAISYINEKIVNEIYNIVMYLDEFETKQKLLLNAFIPTSLNDYNQTTITTWKITLARIRGEPIVGLLAERFLNCIAYLCPENIERSMLAKLSYHNNETDVKQAVRLLVKYSMVNATQKQSLLSVHRLVQHVTRLDMSENEKEVCILKSILKMLQANKIKEEIMFVDHAISAWSYAYSHRNIVSEFSSLPQDIVYTLRRTGFRNAEALAFGTGKLGLMSLNHLPLMHPNRQWMEYQISSALCWQGDYESSLQQVMDLRSRISPENTQLKLQIGRLIGMIHKEQKHPEKAVTHLLKLFADSENMRLTIQNDEVVAFCLADLIECYRLLGNMDEAFKFCILAENKFKQLFGANSEQFVNVSHPTTIVLAAMGKYIDALERFEELYHHKGTRLHLKLNICHNKAYFYFLLGKYEHALEICKEALNGRIKCFGKMHPRTIATLGLKGFIMLCMGPKIDEALKLLSEAYNSLLNTLDGNSYPAVLTKCDLALAFYCKDRSKESLYTVEETIQFINNKFGNRSHEGICATFSFAIILEKTKNYKKCVDILKNLEAMISENFSHHDLLNRIKEIRNRVPGNHNAYPENT